MKVIKIVLLAIIGGVLLLFGIAILSAVFGDDSDDVDAPASEVHDTERSAQFESDLKDSLGVDSFREASGDTWMFHVAETRVEGQNAYIRLQGSREDPELVEMAENAARYVVNLASLRDLDGISWVIVEDGTGVVITQEQI